MLSMELYADDSCCREDTMNLSELAEEYRLNAEERLIFKEYTQNRFKDAKENKDSNFMQTKSKQPFICFSYCALLRNTKLYQTTKTTPIGELFSCL